MLDFDAVSFAAKVEEWLNTNPYRAIMFGRVIDLNHGKEDIPEYAAWLTRVVESILSFDPSAQQLPQEFAVLEQV